MLYIATGLCEPGTLLLGCETSSGLGALGDDGQDLLEQCLDYKAR